MQTETKPIKKIKKLRKICKQHHSHTQSASQHDKSISDRRTDLCVRAAYSQYRHDNRRRPRNRRQLVLFTPDLISVILTGLNLYSKIGKFGGAGGLVPITGFANSVAASAIEYRAEGQVFGIGCKIFTIAGPVILYGILSSWILGVIYFIFSTCGGDVMSVGKQTGKASISFTDPVYIQSTASVVGPKEGDGPLKEYFDMICEDSMFGEKTWESAESTMQKRSRHTRNRESRTYTPRYTHGICR